MKNKRIIIIMISIIIVLAAIIGIIVKNYLENKEDEKSIILKSDLNFEFNSNLKKSDIVEQIDGEIINDNEIDTTKLGSSIISIEYKNKRNKIKTKNAEINIIDTTKPKIFMEDSITIGKGNDINFAKTILSGDDCDPNPKREIVGEYDVNKAGKYNLAFEVTDKSGNKESKDFVLEVIDTSSKNSKTDSSNNKYKFSDVIKKYKNENTRVGIDVSTWQGNIDWEKVKKSGCEFAFIRAGYQTGFDGELEEDEHFRQNIENATKQGIEVGIYFHSYAKSAEETKKQAEWLANIIDGYEIKLPIAFDWESWSSFIECQLSFYDINNMAKTYMQVLEDKGYQTSLYSSRYHLGKIWYERDYSNVWLAEYASETDYEGKYQYWQMCNTGRIDGIDGDVDIDINYVDNN